MIYPYKTGSQSAKNLANAMGIKRIKREGSRYTGSEDKVVINWGASSMPEEIMKSKIINNPDAVKLVSHKDKFFEFIRDKEELCTPDYTTNVNKIYEWLEDGHEVVLRSLANSRSGKGISVISISDTPDLESLNYFMINAKTKFATKYVPKKEEYRVHVVGSKVVGVRRKVAAPETKISNWKVRSHNNGFIFQKENINPDPLVIEQALMCVKICGLDFGAVDVVWNEFRKTAYVLEVNTAPGLEGSTVEDYASALKDYMDSIEASKVKANKNKPKNMYSDVVEALSYSNNATNSSSYISSLMQPQHLDLTYTNTIPTPTSNVEEIDNSF